jgi:hypothetical protein
MKRYSDVSSEGQLPFYTVRELARHFNVHYLCIYRAIRSTPTIKPIGVAGCTILYGPDVLEKLPPALAMHSSVYRAMLRARQEPAAA